MNAWSRLAFGLLGAGVIAICVFLAIRSAPAARHGSVRNMLAIVILLPIVAGGLSLMLAAMRGRIVVRETRFSRRAE